MWKEGGEEKARVSQILVFQNTVLLTIGSTLLKYSRQGMFPAVVSQLNILSIDRRLLEMPSCSSWFERHTGAQSFTWSTSVTEWLLAYYELSAQLQVFLVCMCVCVFCRELGHIDIFKFLFFSCAFESFLSFVVLEIRARFVIAGCAEFSAELVSFQKLTFEWYFLTSYLFRIRAAQHWTGAHQKSRLWNKFSVCFQPHHNVWWASLVTFSCKLIQSDCFVITWMLGCQGISVTSVMGGMMLAGAMRCAHRRFCEKSALT